MSALIRPSMLRAVSFLAIFIYIAFVGGCTWTGLDSPYDYGENRDVPTTRLKAAPVGITPIQPGSRDQGPEDESPAPAPRSPSLTPPLHSDAEATFRPVPTPDLAPLVIKDDPLQSWSNPNDVNGLLYDGQYLWAATGGGIVRWQPGSGESRVYTPSDGLASLAIRGIAQDGEGHIWVGYADHLTWSEYNGERWHSYASREQAVTSQYKAMLTASHLDPRLWSRRENGEWVWLPSGDGRVKAYDGSKWRVYGQAEGVTQNTWLVAVTDGGRVWAIGEGISSAKEGEQKWEDHSLPGEAPEENITTDLAVDGQGRAWLTFASHHPQSAGVSCLDPGSKRWISYAHALNPAIPKQVNCLELDPDGTMWLCGDEGLAFCRPGMRWEHLSWGLSVQSFARDHQGRFWIGTAQGIYSAAADGGDLRGPWLVRASIVSNEVTSLVMDGQGTLWIGTPKGLSYVTASGHTGIALNKNVLSLVSGLKGDLWVGTTDGLYSVQSDGSSRQALAQVASRMAFDDQGALWICTPDGQLGLIEGVEWHPRARLAESAMPLRDMLINADGSVWLGTAKGLGILSAERSFTWADPAERFLKEDVRTLALGPDGVLWIGTISGLARRLPSGRLVRLTSSSTEGGLRSPEIWDLHMTSDGTLWIATSAGISLRTSKADWFYFDLPGVRAIWPESSEVIWVGTRGGLYRLRRELLIAVP